MQSVQCPQMSYLNKVSRIGNKAAMRNFTHPHGLDRIQSPFTQLQGAIRVFSPSDKVGDKHSEQSQIGTRQGYVFPCGCCKKQEQRNQQTPPDCNLLSFPNPFTPHLNPFPGHQVIILFHFLLLLLSRLCVPKEQRKFLLKYFSSKALKGT